MKKVIITSSIIVLVLLSASAFFWFNTQPVWVVSQHVEDKQLKILPAKNKKIIELIEAKGKQLALTYSDVVCTEFVINVINTVQPLTKKEKNDIRIITAGNLSSMIDAEDPVIKGVQTALVKSGAGIAIKSSSDVLPGDFVQFWNVFQGKAYGHCGVVLDIDPQKTITLYSSHPFTDGFGTQKYLWPEKIYFARLRN